MKSCIVLSLSLVFVMAVTACGQKKVSATKAPPTPDVKLFGVNLIKNGNAESENGWTNADELKTILYGEFGGGPDKGSPGPTDRGEKYFYARTTMAQPTAIFSQKIDLTKIADSVDKGDVRYNLGGWFGVASSSSSMGRLRVVFLDKDEKEISTDATAEIKEAAKPEDLALTERSKAGSLPAGARKIRVDLEFRVFPAHLNEDADNLAFADNLSLVLSKKP